VGCCGRLNHSLFANRNRDVTSLHRKFNADVNTTPPTGDPENPAYIQKAKDIQQAMEVKMDSGPLTANALAVEGGVQDGGDDVAGLNDGFDANDIFDGSDNDDIDQVKAAAGIATMVLTII